MFETHLLLYNVFPARCRGRLVFKLGFCAAEIHVEDGNNPPLCVCLLEDGGGDESKGRPRLYRKTQW
jgi:hypothetical protein